MKSVGEFSERPCLEQIISKRKGEFMKNCNFTDNETTLLFDIPPNEEICREYIRKNNIDKSTMCGPRYAEHEVFLFKLKLKVHSQSSVQIKFRIHEDCI